jgi:hypothetical protein
MLSQDSGFEIEKWLSLQLSQRLFHNKFEIGIFVFYDKTLIGRHILDSGKHTPLFV